MDSLMAGVPDNFSLPQVCPVSCTLLTFFLLAACSIHETEQKGYCENIITKKHLDKLQELVSILPSQHGWWDGIWNIRG